MECLDTIQGLLKKDFIAAHRGLTIPTGFRPSETTTTQLELLFLIA